VSEEQREDTGCWETRQAEEVDHPDIGNSICKHKEAQKSTSCLEPGGGLGWGL
jgi:hypothetical protein